MAVMGAGAQLYLDRVVEMNARAQLQAAFPNINHQFELTSFPTEDYNCIAWAAEDVERWWWPTNPDSYWPDGVQRSETLEAFIAAFATLGYSPCSDGALEDGSDKVAIFCLAGVPKHMARQLPSGYWTSKLGPNWDILHHRVHGVNGISYGEPIQFLSRAAILEK